MFRLYPYKVGSASVKKLKVALDALIIKTEGSRYRPREDHLIINWGNSTRPPWAIGSNGVADVAIFNDPEAVALASNKLDTFIRLEQDDVPTVPFTVDDDEARQWLDDGHKVFVRAKLNGHSGEGITVVEPLNIDPIVARVLTDLTTLGYHEQAEQIIIDNEETIPDLPVAPLYTMGISNDGEYRIHVFDGEVILYQKKSRRVNEETGEVETADGEEADVRNLASNWVYRTGNLNRLERVENLAIEAVRALGLDFGAVDIIKDEEGNVFVLEVNTAPGLGNQDTLDAYVSAFNSLI